jgi:hypothetical protein
LLIFGLICQVSGTDRQICSTLWRIGGSAHRCKKRVFSRRRRGDY